MRQPIPLLLELEELLAPASRLTLIDELRFMLELDLEVLDVLTDLGDALSRISYVLSAFGFEFLALHLLVASRLATGTIGSAADQQKCSQADTSDTTRERLGRLFHDLDHGPLEDPGSRQAADAARVYRVKVSAIGTQPRWASKPSPWGVPWHEVIEHQDWFALHPVAPPFAEPTELRLRTLRRRPSDVPRALWNRSAGEPLLDSPLGSLIDQGPAVLLRQLERVSTSEVRELLREPPLERATTGRHLAERARILMSHAADTLRGELTEQAVLRTRQRFERKVRLFAPLYLSSFCTNLCSYCHFSLDNAISRTVLDSPEVEREAQALADSGISEVLLLTGEAPRHFSVGRLVEATSIVARLLPTVRLEVFPLGTSDYEALRQAGASGVTLYQETYDARVYRSVHRGGRKRDLLWRLGALERAACAGFSELGIGALLGLGDWRYEGVALALHADALRRLFPGARIALSFPRLRRGPGGFEPQCPVSDSELEHLMAALRLLLPTSEFVLSTREPPRLRDRLTRLWVNRLSAGSKTRPGGYATNRLELAEQFETHDPRSPAEISRQLRADGFVVR